MVGKLAYHRHTSLLDNDFYNFTMGQVIHDWPGMRDVNVRYEFINRSTDIELGRAIPLGQIREEIEAIKDLSFSPSEIAFLQDQMLFNSDYIEFLDGSLKLPEVHVDAWDGQLIIAYEGEWQHAIFWETPLLSLVKQLYYVNTLKLPPLYYTQEGNRRLNYAIDSFKRHKYPIVEMGTRRRFSPSWQLQVVERLQRELPSFLGTSNVKLAMDLNLTPIGTMAHQIMMVTGAVSVADGGEGKIALVRAQNEVMNRWEKTYAHRPEMMTLLADTWGTKFFLDNVDPQRVEQWWSGLRQDSGNPFDICHMMVDWLFEHGMNKTIIPSDDLQPAKMLLLKEEFQRECMMKYGIGTFLTSNIEAPLPNIVIKPVWADEYPCVKLSDNPNKATGDPEAIIQYKRLTSPVVNECF